MLRESKFHFWYHLTGINNTRLYWLIWKIQETEEEEEEKEVKGGLLQAVFPEKDLKLKLITCDIFLAWIQSVQLGFTHGKSSQKYVS